jgi:hypothetical protein
MTGVEADSRDPEKVCDVSDCNAWKSGEWDYCHHHKGLQQTDGAPEGNQNATRHSLYSTPEYLKEHFTEEQDDRYIAYFEALCTRYERFHNREPDDFAKDRLSRVAIECVKERIADEWLAEQADETGNLLIESHIIGVDDDGRPISVEQENQILKELTALKRETRLTLKDMGLLESPEKQQADAARELGQLVKESLED